MLLDWNYEGGQDIPIKSIYDDKNIIDELAFKDVYFDQFSGFISKIYRRPIVYKCAGKKCN